MKALLPARSEGLVFAVILSGLMSCIVTAIVTFRALGLTSIALRQLFASWPISWAMALPVVFTLAPLVRRLAGAITGNTGT